MGKIRKENCVWGDFHIRSKNHSNKLALERQFLPVHVTLCTVRVSSVATLEMRRGQLLLVAILATGMSCVNFIASNREIHSILK